MNHQPINLANKFRMIDKHWSPRVIAELNDYQFKLATLLGEFIWHSHADTDEAFYVVEGALTILFRDGQVNLGQGELFVVPKGIEHKPVAKKECRVLLIEPRDVVNTGTGTSPSLLTAKVDQWI